MLAYGVEQVRLQQESLRCTLFRLCQTNSLRVEPLLPKVDACHLRRLGNGKKKVMSCMQITVICCSRLRPSTLAHLASCEADRHQWVLALPVCFTSDGFLATRAAGYTLIPKSLKAESMQGEA